MIYTSADIVPMLLFLLTTHKNKKILDPINNNIFLLTTTTNDDDDTCSCNAGLAYHTRVFKDRLENSRVLKGTSPQCIAFDPRNSNRAYCGTFGDGLWKTDDVHEHRTITIMADV